MQKEPYKSAELTTENADHMQVRYYLDCCTSSVENEPRDTYGITAQLFEGDQLIEQARIRDITCSKSEAVSLIEILSRNTVTPVTLKDVIEDYVAGK